MILKRFSDMLRDLFQSQARPKEDATAERAARLEKNVLKLVGNMPAMPDTAMRAIALADNPNTDFAQLARAIEGDVSIAAGLLRIANSAFNTSGNPATNLHQAVVRLGRFQCKNLIVSISLKSLLWKMAGDEKEECEALWHHGYLTASLCAQFNRAFLLRFNGEEFSGGLLHDLGRILLLLADPECFVRAGANDFREGPDILQRERTAIGIDHCALGAWYGEHSKLPETLIEVMRFHHEPDSMEHSSRLIALVAMADHMANHFQVGEDIETYNPEENLGLTVLAERWPDGRKERLLGDIPLLMEESLRAASASS